MKTAVVITIEGGCLTGSFALGELPAGTQLVVVDYDNLEGGAELDDLGWAQGLTPLEKADDKLKDIVTRVLGE